MVEASDSPRTLAELGPQTSAELAISAEQTWADAGERLRGVNATEKFIELKERELQNVIAQNYARIQGVEKELQGLQLQLKLTSGPKRSALEMLRRKIEAQTDRIVSARVDAQAAQKVADTAAERLAAEERAKDLLCQELNLLVQQSAHAQLQKLETLTRRLEALNAPAGGPEATAVLQQRIAEVAAGEAAAANAADAVVAGSSTTGQPAGQAAGGRAQDGSTATAPTTSSENGVPDQQSAADAEASAKTREQAAAARARHIAVGSPRRTASPARGRGTRPARVAPAAASPTPSAPRGAFQGFDT